MADTYSTSTLISVIEDIRRPDPFLLNMFFPSLMLFDTEEIVWDEILRGKPIAPFVSPLVKGKVMRQQGYSTKTFRPAYVKPKQVLRPHVALKRRAGERLSGDISAMERKEAWIADNFREQDWMIKRRKEWMATRALLDGIVTVVGEDYPEVQVDFNRDPSLTVILAGPALWSDPLSTPLQDVEDWSNDMNSAPFGTPANVIVMPPDVWKVFIKHQDIVDSLNNEFKGTQTFQLDTTVVSEFEMAKKRGTINGDIEVWVYGDEYEDETGVLTPYIDPGKIIMGHKMMTEGVQAHGAILDVDVLRPLEFFPKMWKQEDPSVIFTMTESAPLVVPGRPNATFSASVL